MEIAYITTISLVWLIYTFLISDADKQVIDVLNRLRFALSVDINTHSLSTSLLQAHGQMGIPEIIAYGKGMADSDPTMAKRINGFEIKYEAIEKFKRILMWNLFILTAHAVIFSISCFSSILLIQIHVIISLFLGLIFYWYTRKKLSTLVFSKVQF